MKLRLIAWMCVALACSGCERGMHEMYEQPKDKPLTPSPLFADGNSSRPSRQGPSCIRPARWPVRAVVAMNASRPLRHPAPRCR